MDRAMDRDPKDGVSVNTLLETLSRNRWMWMLDVRGLLAILFGIAAWIWPGVTLNVLVSLCGAYALVDGVFASITGIASSGENRRWWAEVLTGVASIVLGVMAFVWPGVTALTLLDLFAAWAIVTGVTEIAAAVELRRTIDTESLLRLGGLASVLFGLLLIVFPGSGAPGLLWLIGAHAVLFGVLLIALGFRRREMGNSAAR